MNTVAHRKGQFGEEQARHYLCRQGLKCLASNFRIRRGEIDLIMLDNDEVVFVEVRTRAGGPYGDGIDSITRGKQQRLIAAASAWLQRQRGEPATRFDVVSIDADGRITWMQDAFRVDG